VDDSFDAMSTDSQAAVAAIPEPDLLDTPGAGPAAIRGSLVRVAGYGAGVLLSLLSVPLLIQHLGFIEYGRYVTVISLVTIVQGITDVGLGQIGVREYVIRAGSARERLMRNLLGVRVTLTCVGVGLATAFAGLAGYGHAVVVGTLLAGLAMMLSVVQGTFAIPLSAQLRLSWVTALELMRQILSVAAIVALVLVGANLLAFLAVLAPVALVVLAATMLRVQGTMPMRPAFERADWSILMRSVLPFAAAVVIGTLYLRITVVLMSLLASASQTGYYATSYVVISVLVAIPALTVGSTLPVLARAARDDHERLGYVLQRLFEVTSIIGVGLGLTLALGAGFVMQVLAKGKSPISVDVLEIQSLALITSFLASSWQYGLLSLHRHRALLLISVTSLTMSVLLTLILVPVMQARGAALAFSGAEIVMATSSFIALKLARPDLRVSLRVPLRVLIAAASASAVLLVPGLGSLPRALIASVLYFGILMALHAVPTELVQALLRRPQLAKP
jgi:O-antigen/teichoic acid export membrane protein